MAVLTDTDIRVSSPIASRTMTAALADVKGARLTRWSHAPQTGARPLVHTVTRTGKFTVPLVGIAEAVSVAALVDAGLSLHKVRQATEFVRDHFSDEYALASPSLFTDGVELFIKDHEGFYRERDRQGTITAVARRFLRPLRVDRDGVVEAVTVDKFGNVDVTVDPRFNAGAMSFTESRLPVFVVAEAIGDGADDREVAEEYRISIDAVRRTRELSEWLAGVDFKA